MNEPESNRLDTREVRYADGLELRAAKEGKQGPGMLVGYAAPFNRLSEPVSDKGSSRKYREKIEPGAFREVIKSTDIFAYPSHKDERVLGRNTAGTLRMQEDSKGLRVEIDLPDTQAGRDAAYSVGRGDVTGMSFAFDVGPGGERWDFSSDLPTRTVSNISLVDHICLANRPAYTDTRVALRSLEAAEAANAVPVTPPVADPVEPQFHLTRVKARLRLLEAT